MGKCNDPLSIIAGGVEEDSSTTHFQVLLPVLLISCFTYCHHRKHLDLGSKNPELFIKAVVQIFLLPYLYVEQLSWKVLHLLPTFN